MNFLAKILVAQNSPSFWIFAMYKCVLRKQNDYRQKNPKTNPHWRLFLKFLKIKYPWLKKKIEKKKRIF